MARSETLALTKVRQAMRSTGRGQSYLIVGSPLYSLLEGFLRLLGSSLCTYEM